MKIIRITTLKIVLDVISPSVLVNNGDTKRRFLTPAALRMDLLPGQRGRGPTHCPHRLDAAANHSWKRAAIVIQPRFRHEVAIRRYAGLLFFLDSRVEKRAEPLPAIIGGALSESNDLSNQTILRAVS
jgi:hypothetical protein